MEDVGCTGNQRAVKKEENHTAPPSAPALPCQDFSQTHVDKDDIKFLIPLPKDWGHRCVPLYLVCAVLRINPRASGMLGKDSANCAPSPAREVTGLLSLFHYSPLRLLITELAGLLVCLRSCLPLWDMSFYRPGALAYSLWNMLGK